MPVYNFSTLDDPLASGGNTFASGINDTDQIVGWYFDKDVRSHGYIFDANSGAYTTLDDPFGAGGTFAGGINDRGLVVGSYLDADNFSGHYHGFLYDGRIYTTLDDPLGTFGTYAYGINGAGLVVGRYIDHTGTHGFLYNPNGGTYTTLDDPLAANEFDRPFGPTGTVAEGINGAGQIVGYYADNNGDEHGFLYNGGIYTTIDDPGAFGTTAFGINKNGHVVGGRFDKFGDHGFLEIPAPNPPPPAGTTADLILRGSNTSLAVAGQYQIYDIGNNAILAGYSLAQIGTDWQFAGLGGFFGSDTTDMLCAAPPRAASRSTTSATTTSPTPPSSATSGSIGRSWGSAISAARPAKPT
jgi:probable HAF family extracellular repeat protein